MDVGRNKCSGPKVRCARWIVVDIAASNAGARRRAGSSPIILASQHERPLLNALLDRGPRASFSFMACSAKGRETGVPAARALATT